MGIRFLGVVIVTRQIGPHAFGTYSGAAAFIAVAVLLSQMGMEIYLIRQPEEPSKRDYDEVFTFIAVLSAIIVLAFFGLSVLYVHFRPSAGSSVNVFRLLLISVPLNALWAPAQARIERSFGFRNMAILELGGDVILYLVAASPGAARLGCVLTRGRCRLPGRRGFWSVVTEWPECFRDCDFRIGIGVSS